MSALPPSRALARARARAARSPLRELLARFFESRLASAGAVLLAAMLLAAMFAPWIAPQDPYDLAQLDVLDARLPPGSPASAGGFSYWLGSDEQGRDLWSAILYGLRISVFVGFVSTAIALVIGGLLGLVAGFFGGRIDALLMRLADLQLAFPPILVALILLVLTGPGVSKIIIALVTVQWATYARTARSAAMVESRKEYLEAAAVLGLSAPRRLLRHLLPNCSSPLVVLAALQIGSAISLEATLSFLGLGLPITEPSLGLLIANGFQTMTSGKLWISLYPGLALLALVVAINLVADRLRDLLDPRLELRQ